MSHIQRIALACAWKARGELARFQQLYNQIAQQYPRIVIALPPDTDAHIVQTLQGFPHIVSVVTTNWAAGRHVALQHACVDDIEFVHYVDFERMLRWFETAPHEIPPLLDRLQGTDCLIIGRTPHAFATHAQALQQTEAIINTVFSAILGQAVELGGGSRGFSRRAVEFLLQHSPPERAIGTDAEWPILLHRAGYRIDTTAVDGLTWEVPDHYKARAVDATVQRATATAYDADATRWELRVETAFEIVQAGLDAHTRPLNL